MQLARRLGELLPAAEADRPHRASSLFSADTIDERYVVRDAEEVRQTLEHFARNINRLIDRCRQAGVAVVLCIEAANLRDWQYLVTEPGERFPGDVLRAQLKKRRSLPRGR